MIGINPSKCIQTAEEMSATKKALLCTVDSLTEACSALKDSGDDSLWMIARTLEKYVSDMQTEGRIIETMSLILEKISETYIRTENDTQDFIDQIPTTPDVYGTVMLGTVTEKANEYFEVF